MGLFSVTRPAVVSAARSVGAVPLAVQTGRAWKLKPAAGVIIARFAWMHIAVMVAALVFNMPPVMHVADSMNCACVMAIEHEFAPAPQAHVQVRLSV